MILRTLTALAACIACAGCTCNPSTPRTDPNTQPSAGNGNASTSEPLSIGETFTINSRVMSEVRRINVFVPTMYGQKFDEPLPVLYMPDGGVNEDFIHIAGLMQALVSNGGMRPFMLVGIENTQRRRDMTGPTKNPEDRKIAPSVGGSETFRRFIREELMPIVKARHRTAPQTAIVGESLAGLFVVETFLLEPDLFDTYIAIDPSLWWNNQSLVNAMDAHLKSFTGSRPSIFLTNSDEPGIAKPTAQLAAIFAANSEGSFNYHYAPLPTETHATIYHPAAMLAFRSMLAPASTHDR